MPDELAAPWEKLFRLHLSIVVNPGISGEEFFSLVRLCRAKAREVSYAVREDKELLLNWPASDSAAIALLKRSGFRRTKFFATLDIDEVPLLRGEGKVRPIRGEDLDRAAGLWLEEIRFDASFGAVQEIDSTHHLLRRQIQEILSDERIDAWVYEDQCSFYGIAVVSWPESTSWVSPLVTHPGHAYFSCIYADPDYRSRGVGKLLAAHAHQRAREHGVQRIALHFSCLNPISPSFWRNMGYRDLWNAWTIDPTN